MGNLPLLVSFVTEQWQGMVMVVLPMWASRNQCHVHVIAVQGVLASCFFSLRSGCGTAASRDGRRHAWVMIMRAGDVTLNS